MQYIYQVYNTYYYYYPIYTTLIIPISYPSQFPQWPKLVSTPEAVVGAPAQSQMEAVILHTLFTTFTFYSQFFYFLELADSRKHQHQNGAALQVQEQNMK
jgi:hypothetical protein